MDVVVVLDGSGSVGPANFDRQVQATLEFVRQLDLAAVQVALVVMGSPPVFAYALDDLRSAGAWGAALAALAYSPGQPADARDTFELIRNSVLTAAAGYRGGAATVLVLSDGDTSDSDEMVALAAQRLVQETQAVVATVAVGQTSADALQLPLMASDAADRWLLTDVERDPTLLPLAYLCNPNATGFNTTTPASPDLLCPASAQRPLDLVLVIDASGSVGEQGFLRQVEAAVALARVLSLGTMQVAAVTVTTQPAIMFDFTAAAGSNAILEGLLWDLPYAAHESSGLAMALDTVVTELLQPLTGFRGGDTLVLVFTDGAVEALSMVERAADLVRAVPADLATIPLGNITGSDVAKVEALTNRSRLTVDFDVLAADGPVATLGPVLCVPVVGPSASASVARPSPSVQPSLSVQPSVALSTVAPTATPTATPEPTTTTVVVTTTTPATTTIPVGDGFCNPLVQDVVLVLDGTLLMDQARFDQQRQLAAALLEQLATPGHDVRVAVLVQGDSPITPLFSLAESTTVNFRTLAGLVRAVPLPGADTGARPAEALNAARAALTAAQGYRGGRAVVVYFGPPVGTEDNITVTEAAARLWRDLAGQVTTVGVNTMSDTLAWGGQLDLLADLLLPLDALQVVPGLGFADARLDQVLCAANGTTPAPTTTGAPTTTPVFEFCEFRPLDLVVVLDASGSIGAEAFVDQLDAVDDLVRRLPLNDTVRVAVAVVHQSASIVLDWQAGADQSALREALLQLVYAPAEPSPLAQTLDLVRSALVLGPSYGGRDVLAVVFTDGADEPTPIVGATMTALRQAVAPAALELLLVPVGPLEPADEATLAALQAALDNVTVTLPLAALRAALTEAPQADELTATLFCVNGTQFTTPAPPTTTPAPTTTPQVPLRCDFKPLDILFMVDASGSQGEAAFRRQLQLAAAIVAATESARPGDDEIRFALVLVQRSPPIIFTLTSNRTAVYALLASTPYPRRESTRLADTFDVVYDVLLTPDGGYRGGPALFFLLHDGSTFEPLLAIQFESSIMRTAGPLVALNTGASDSVVLSAIADVVLSFATVESALLDEQDGSVLFEFLCDAPLTTAAPTARPTASVAVTTTPAPTPEPVCDFLPLDLVILLDGTGSLGVVGFRQQQQVIIMLLQGLPVAPGLVHVSLVLVTSQPSVLLTLQNGRDLALVIEFVRNLDYPPSGRIAEALSVVRRQVVTAAAGHRPEAPVLMLTLSDSRSVDVFSVADMKAKLLEVVRLSSVAIALVEPISAPHLEELLLLADTPDDLYTLNEVAAIVQDDNYLNSSLLQDHFCRPRDQPVASSSVVVVRPSASSLLTAAPTPVPSSSVLATVRPSLVVTRSVAVLSSSSAAAPASASASRLVTLQPTPTPSVAFSSAVSTGVASASSAVLLSTVAPTPSPSASLPVFSASLPGLSASLPGVSASRPGVSASRPGVSASVSQPAPSASPAPTLGPFCDYRAQDVVFLLDGSGSAGAAMFARLKALAANLVGASPVGANATQVAAVVINSASSVVFDFAASTDAEVLQQLILDLEYPRQQASHIASALDAVREDLVMSNTSGYRGGELLVVMLTDGYASTSDTLVEHAAERLKVLPGVSLFAVDTNQEPEPTPLLTAITDGRLVPLAEAEAAFAARGARNELVRELLCEVPVDNNATSTTAPPGGEPCEQKTLDVVLVLDAAGSVGLELFLRQLQFAAQFVGALQVGVDQVRVAAVVTRQNPAQLFDLADLLDRTAMQQVLLGLDYPSLEQAALARTLDLVRLETLQVSAGYRDQEALVVVFSNEVAVEGSDLVSRAAAKLTFASDTQVVGVSLEDSTLAHRLQLQAMSSGGRFFFLEELEAQFEENANNNLFLQLYVCRPPRPSVSVSVPPASPVVTASPSVSASGTPTGTAVPSASFSAAPFSSAAVGPSASAPPAVASSLVSVGPPQPSRSVASVSQVLPTASASGRVVPTVSSAPGVRPSVSVQLASSLPLPSASRSRAAPSSSVAFNFTSTTAAPNVTTAEPNATTTAEPTTTVPTTTEPPIAPPFLLNPLQPVIVAFVGEGVFSFQIPDDTFYDEVYGFDLVYALVNSSIPDWLSYNPQTRTFVGVPTNDDAGAVGFRVVATNPAGVTSAPHPFAIGVVPSFQVDPNPETDIVLQLPDLERRRRGGRALLQNAPVQCAAGITGTQRADLLAGVAAVLAVPVSVVGLREVVDTGQNCEMVVTVTDNRALNCSEAAATVAQAEASGALAAALNNYTTAFQLVAVDGRVRPCAASPPVPAKAVVDNQNAQVSLLPVGVVALVVLLIGLLLLLLLRHRANKDKLGIDLRTFGPRKPIKLGVEKQLRGHELLPRELAGSLAEPSGPGKWASGQAPAPAYVPASARAPAKDPPPYRPPPVYPADLDAQVTPAFLNDTTDFFIDDGFTPDGYTTVTTTTTVVTSHGTDRPVPQYISPPDYALSLGLHPQLPRQPPVFVRPPAYSPPRADDKLDLPAFTLPGDVEDLTYDLLHAGLISLDDQDQDRDEYGGYAAPAPAAAPVPPPPPPPYRQPPAFQQQQMPPAMDDDDEDDDHPQH